MLWNYIVIEDDKAKIQKIEFKSVYSSLLSCQETRRHIDKTTNDGNANTTTSFIKCRKAMRSNFTLFLFLFLISQPWRCSFQNCKQLFLVLIFKTYKGIEFLSQAKINSDSNIFAIIRCKPFIFQTQTILFISIISLKYLRSTTLGYKDIEIRKSEFVAKTQLI